MKTLLIALALFTSPLAFAHIRTELGLADCFGYRLIQIQTEDAKIMYVVRPIDGNSMHDGYDIPAQHQSFEDRDLFTAYISMSIFVSPDDGKLIISRSFEPLPTGGGTIVYRAGFEWKEQKAGASLCKNLN